MSTVSPTSRCAHRRRSCPAARSPAVRLPRARRRAEPAHPISFRSRVSPPFSCCSEHSRPAYAVMSPWRSFMPLLRLQRVLTVAASLMVVLASASAQSPPFTYLFDLLKQPTFHRSFDQLFEGQPNVDEWIRVFQKTNNGVASP